MIAKLITFSVSYEDDEILSKIEKAKKLWPGKWKDKILVFFIWSDENAWDHFTFNLVSDEFSKGITQNALCRLMGGDPLYNKHTHTQTHTHTHIHFISLSLTHIQTHALKVEHTLAHTHYLSLTLIQTHTILHTQTHKHTFPKKQALSLRL